MRIAAVPRWAISFADLGLLLIACFVMLNAMEAARPKATAGQPVAPAPQRVAEAWQAAAMFEAGEARLTEAARATLHVAGARLAGRPIRIVSHGGAESGPRLDRFELAAARSAAVARTLREAGVAERDIEVSIEDSGETTGQIIEIVRR